MILTIDDCYWLKVKQQCEEATASEEDSSGRRKGAGGRTAKSSHEKKAPS